jgi:broad specificity phosphatase PhoE
VLYLARHGQTTANAAGLVQGQRDPELTEVGVRQAATLVSVLPAAARVVSSPLRRARVTAAALDRPVEVDDRWIEIDFGELEYRPVAEIRESVWPKWREDPEWVPAGGESLGDVARRVGPACDALAALDLGDSELARIGAAARERTLDEHTAARRVLDLERALGGA